MKEKRGDDDDEDEEEVEVTERQGLFSGLSCSALKELEDQIREVTYTAVKQAAVASGDQDYCCASYNQRDVSQSSLTSLAKKSLKHARLFVGGQNRVYSSVNLSIGTRSDREQKLDSLDLVNERRERMRNKKKKKKKKTRRRYQVRNPRKVLFGDSRLETKRR